MLPHQVSDIFPNFTHIGFENKGSEMFMLLYIWEVFAVYVNEIIHLFLKWKLCHVILAKYWTNFSMH